MLHFKKHLRFFLLLGCIFNITTILAVTDNELMRLEADMLKYINTNERDTFFIVTDKLKEACKEAGNDRLFHTAWSNQAIYDATHQYYSTALDLSKEMLAYAQREGCVYGEYAAMHTEAMVLMQMQDYEAAQKAFLKAVDFRHRRFPNESAAEDLRELMKIAYMRDDPEMARNYANQLLAEPNLAPHHKGRTLYRLSIMAFDENNVEEFNHVYDEMNRLAQTDGISMQSVFTNVNHLIINGDYKQALLLADRLSADTCAERKAIIYHRLGDDAKAYEHMVQYKHISDSLARASHNNEVASLYLRMNNDRLRLEQELLANQNGQLRLRFYITAGILLIVILLFVIYKRFKIIRLLKRDNSMLDYGKKGAERALKDLNELSYYESKNDLPLTIPVKVNKLCDHLANITQNHCNKSVTTVFMTEFSDEFEILSNPEALEKILTHLLNDSSRFTHDGMIKLQCTDAGDYIRFTITDTSSGHSSKPKESKSRVFAEQDDTVRYISMNFNICQSISRLLRGRLWHDEAYREGTRFCFEIPKEPVTNIED